MAKRKIKNNFKNKIKIKKPLHLAPFVIVFIMCLSFLIGIINFFKNSSYFDIREIICADKMKEQKINKFLELKGENIFSLDLATISEKLKGEYPETSEIIVSRIFPDILSVEFKERIPIARFKLSNQEFLIDQEAVVLGSLKSIERKDLPDLKGLNINFKDLKVGQKIRSRNLSFAIGLLREMNAVGLLNQYKILELDVSNLNKISFIMHNEIVVLTRRIDFSKKLDILISLLSRLEQELEEISYIDLRFRDPVIKKK